VVFQGPTSLPRRSVIDPLLEAELVFLVESALSPDSSIDDILDGCRVAAGIEIADSRWEGWLPRDPDRFVVPTHPEIEADNAVCGGLVVSNGSVPARALGLPDLDIAVRANGEEVGRGSLRKLMGHPAEAVRWLIQLLAQSGISLLPGQFVSSGCPYSNFVTVPPEGGTWEVGMDGLESARLTFTA
jgi:2-keto-4-pentenoate hydratase